MPEEYINGSAALRSFMQGIHSRNVGGVSFRRARSQGTYRG